MGTDDERESNGDRTDASERYRELGRRSGEARRRKKEQQLEPVGDREQALAALRRALDGNNRAAMVAAAKALIEHDQSPPAGPVSVEDARAKLAAKLDEIEGHRRRALEDGRAKACPTCGAYMSMEDRETTVRGVSGTVQRAPGQGG